jgi:hypothetical protein
MKGVFQVFLAKGSKSSGLFPAADSGLGFGRGLSHGSGVTLFGKVILCNTKLEGVLLVLGLMRGCSEDSWLLQWGKAFHRARVGMIWLAE